MGFFDFLKKKKQSGMVHAPTMTGGAPFYSPFGESVYESDIVVQSILRQANEFKKLDPRHIRITDGKQQTVTDSSIAKMFKRPNPFMTPADFLEKIKILLELNKNVFIYPTYYITRGGEKYFTGIYPLKPSYVEYLLDEGGRMFIHLQFANGYDVTLHVEEVVHWRKNYGLNDYFGGGAFGGDDNAGQRAMLERYDQLTQSIAKAIQCSCQINGIVQYSQYLDEEKLETAKKEFYQRLGNNESGLLFTDQKFEYTNMPHDVKLVDGETLDFFYKAILRTNGTSLAILDGDYTKGQKEAFYETALESDIKSLGQGLAKCLFTDREAAFGNDVKLYPNDIVFMSMENKLAALQVGLPAGIFTKNEARELLGYPPVEGGDVMPRGYNELDDTNKPNDTGEGNPPATE